MELVPYVGPFLGAPRRCSWRCSRIRSPRVWVGLLFVALQQIEGHIVAPLVFGNALRINPLLVIFALLFGGELFGILGALLALPIGGGGARDGRLPARAHVFEPWGTASPLAIVGARTGARRRRLPGVRRPSAQRDAYCRRCGADLYTDAAARRARGG